MQKLKLIDDKNDSRIGIYEVNLLRFGWANPILKENIRFEGS